MNRLFLTIGSLTVELLALSMDGLLAGTVCMAGVVVSGVHWVCSGKLFHHTVDRLTGCHLPDSLTEAEHNQK